METGVSLERLRSLSPVIMAYIGDAVYELYVRKLLISQGPEKISKLHKQAVSCVNASTQAKLYHYLEEHQLLTEEELAIIRRGRNAKTGQSPKNADITDYRHSTGLECLVGYLHLKGEEERLEQLLGYLADIVSEWGNGK